MEKLFKRKVAELALLYSMPDFCDAKENSRLAGLQRQLQKATAPNLNLIRGFTDKEFREILHKIIQWSKDVGWARSPEHIGTLVSFCLDMVENSPIPHNKKIVEILVKLAEHLENGKELYPKSCIDGQAAANRWAKVYE